MLSNKTNGALSILVLDSPGMLFECVVAWGSGTLKSLPPPPSALSLWSPLPTGLVLLHCNFFTCTVWACAAVLGTQTHHSGYRWPYVMPFDNQPDYHDFHHKEFTTYVATLK